MVASSVASATAVGGQPARLGLADTPATTASIAAYLDSGERIRGLTDVALKLCAGVVVLVAVAWALGVLPGAVKLV